MVKICCQLIHLTWSIAIKILLMFVKHYIHRKNQDKIINLLKMAEKINFSHNSNSSMAVYTVTILNIFEWQSSDLDLKKLLHWFKQGSDYTYKASLM